MKTRVLLVEDDNSVQKSLTRSLQGRFDVVSAHTVEAALRVHESEPCDAMLLDLDLPDGSGFDVLAAFAAQGSDIPTVVLSGHLSPSAYRAAFEAGVVEVLEKGSDWTAVEAALDLALTSVDSVRGAIHGLSFVDMLQMFHYGRRTLRVEVFGSLAGTIDVRDGELVHAQLGKAVGADALQGLLSCQHATVRTAALPLEGPVTLELPFEALLLDCLRLVDESSMDDRIPSLFPDAAPPPPESVTTLTEHGVDTALLPVFESTVGRLCESAQILLARQDGRLVWLFRDDKSQPPDAMWLAAVDSVREQLSSWQWVIRLTERLAVALIHAGDDVAVVYSALPTKASSGVFHIAVMRAYEQLRALDPRPSFPRGEPSPSALAAGPHDGNCEAIVHELQPQHARACRVWSDREASFVGAHRLETTSADSVPEGAWRLARLALTGSLGVALDTLARGHERTSDAEEADAVDVLVSATGRLVFGRTVDPDLAVFVSTKHATNVGMVGIRMRSTVTEMVRTDGERHTLPSKMG